MEGEVMNMNHGNTDDDHSGKQAEVDAARPIRGRQLQAQYNGSELDPYQALASQVCATCMADYYKALLMLRCNPSSVRAQHEIVEDEAFFRSTRFELFTTLDMTGEEVIAILRKRAAGVKLSKGIDWDDRSDEAADANDDMELGDDTEVDDNGD